VTVPYQTVDGTAASPGDYRAVSGVVSFAPGQTSRPVRIAVVGDQVAEGLETFSVQLGAPTNAVLADAEGLASIVDND
jgi:hypothetical protein